MVLAPSFIAGILQDQEKPNETVGEDVFECPLFVFRRLAICMPSRGRI